MPHLGNTNLFSHCVPKSSATLQWEPADRCLWILYTLSLHKKSSILILPLLCSSFAVPSIQRPEAGLLLVRGQIRAASARLWRQGAGRNTVLQPGEQMREWRDAQWTERGGQRILGGVGEKTVRERADFTLACSFYVNIWRGSRPSILGLEVGKEQGGGDQLSLLSFTAICPVLREPLSFLYKSNLRETGRESYHLHYSFRERGRRDFSTHFRENLFVTVTRTQKKKSHKKEPPLFLSCVFVCACVSA